MIWSDIRPTDLLLTIVWFVTATDNPGRRFEFPLNLDEHEYFEILAMYLGDFSIGRTLAMSPKAPLIRQPVEADVVAVTPLSAKRGILL